MDTDAFTQWERTVSASERSDAIWQTPSYRLSRFLIPSARSDARTLYSAPLGRPLMSQLWRAAGSIPANIAEGFSRGTGADRARFFEFALGSTRECIVWYESAREILADPIVEDRLDTLVQVRRLLLSALPRMRAESVRR